MVRIITCWSLSRYIQWVLLPPGSEVPHTAQGQPPAIKPENEVRGQVTGRIPVGRHVAEPVAVHVCRHSTVLCL